MEVGESGKVRWRVAVKMRMRLGMVVECLRWVGWRVWFLCEYLRCECEDGLVVCVVSCGVVCGVWCVVCGVWGMRRRMSSGAVS